MDTSKLIAFAQTLGADNKAMKQLIDTKIDNAMLMQAIEQAKTAVKNDILEMEYLNSMIHSRKLLKK